MLYTLNFHSDVCQLVLNKIEKNFEAVFLDTYKLGSFPFSEEWNLSFIIVRDSLCLYAYALSLV